RLDIMEMVTDGRTMHGGTYNSSPLVCAAVIAAAGVTGAPGVYDDLEARGPRPGRRLGRARAGGRAGGGRAGRGRRGGRRRGLLERDRRPLPALVRARAAEGLPHGPRHRPGQP